jgi:hypothetical protein
LRRLPALGSPIQYRRAAANGRIKDYKFYQTATPIAGRVLPIAANVPYRRQNLSRRMIACGRSARAEDMPVSN